MPLAEGKNVGGFRIIRKIGAGGMGSVYLAEQLAMGRTVALKVLAPELTRSALFQERFEKEIRLQASLSHPNIATAYDAGHDGPLYYLAMEYIEGRGLDAIVGKLGVLKEATALRVTRQVAVALSYAWKSARLIHRDIKPSNILVDDDWNVKILDMGVSKSLKGLVSSDDATQYIVGTPQYMAPEQMRSSEDIDHRADIYALGATLYHMVTGHPPYDGKNLAEIVDKMQEAPAPHPREFNSDISTSCVQLIRVMMACDPENRYSYWSSLVAEVSRVLANQKPMAGTPGKSDSYVAASARVLGKEAASRPKAAEVSARAAATRQSATSTTPESSNWAIVAIGVLALLIVILLAAIISDISGAKPTVAAPPPSSVSAPSPAARDPEPPPPASITVEPLPERVETQGVEEADTASESYIEDQEIKLQLEDLYQFLVRRMEAQPLDFREHLKGIRQLRVDADFYGFSRYLLLADELEAELKKTAREESRRILSELSERAEAAWEAGSNELARALLLQYDGPMALRTRPQRQKMALALQERTQQLQQEQQARLDMQEETLNRLIEQAADRILDGESLADVELKAEQATASFEESPLQPTFQELQRQIRRIRNLPAHILEGFRNRMTREVFTISTQRGTLTVRLVELEPPFLVVERKLEQGEVELRLHVDELSLSERISRLNHLNEADQNLLTAVLALRARQPRPAVDYLEKVPGRLSRRLKDRIVERGLPMRSTTDTLHQLLGLVNEAYLGNAVFRLRSGEIVSALIPEDSGIRDISPLRTHPIDYLKIEAPGVADISAVSDMPLSTLILKNTAVVDLSPIQSTPLKKLSVEDSSGVRTLEPLRQISLEALDIRGTGVTDLEPVLTAPLENLMLNTNFTSLADLANFPLTDLDITGLPVDSLIPLKGLRLESIFMTGTQVTDLTPLADMPLEKIRLDPERIRTGLHILTEIPSLDRIAESRTGTYMTREEFRRRQQIGAYDPSNDSM